MAIGKNKKLGKRKGGKKKIVDPFTKKDWYDIKVPSIFDNRLVGKTPITRSAGQRVASEEMKGRVFEISLGDLNNEAEDQSFRKIRLICEEVQGKNVLCNFYGMQFTRDKLCSLIRKWNTLIEANVDVKTADGYQIRMFCIAFTNRRQNQLRKTSYAQSSQIRSIRKKMVDIMTAEGSKSDLKDLFKKLIAESIGRDIKASAEAVYPLRDVYIRKVKILKSPKFDLTRLMELHGGGGEDKGKAVKKVEEGTTAALEGAGGRL
jgi:small subunit ribosomal protein S3Ae